jgi:hypothetical protein
MKKVEGTQPQRRMIWRWEYKLGNEHQLRGTPMSEDRSLPIILGVALIGFVIAAFLLPPDVLDVRPDRGPPVADAGPDITVAYGQEAVLDGSGSSDDKTIKEWVWEITEGVNVTFRNGERVTYIFERPGEYQVVLKVTDGSGGTDTDLVVVTVLEP